MISHPNRSMTRIVASFRGHPHAHLEPGEPVTVSLDIFPVAGEPATKSLLLDGTVRRVIERGNDRAESGGGVIRLDIVWAEVDLTESNERNGKTMSAFAGQPSKYQKSKYGERNLAALKKAGICS